MAGDKSDGAVGRDAVCISIPDSILHQIRLQLMQKRWNGTIERILKAVELDLKVDIFQEHLLKLASLPPKRGQKRMAVPALGAGGMPPFNPGQLLFDHPPFIFDVAPVMPARRKEIEMDIAMAGKALQILKK